MKKFVSTLSLGLVSILLMLSCSSPVSKMKSIADDAEKNGAEWSNSKWASKSAEVVQLQKEIEDKDLTSEQETEFDEALQKYNEQAAKFVVDKAKDFEDSEEDSPEY